MSNELGLDFDASLDLSTRHLRALVAVAQYRNFAAAALAAGIDLDSHFTVGQFTTAFQLVAEGLGVAIVPST